MRMQQGFNLIELMIVIAVLALLGALAVPQYQDHVSRTRATAAIAELDGFRKAIAECMTLHPSGSGCDAGTNGIPSLPSASRNVAWISLTDGVITATSAATEGPGGANLSIIQSPVAAGALLTWTNTGTICNAVRGLRPGQGGCP